MNKHETKQWNTELAQQKAAKRKWKKDNLLKKLENQKTPVTGTQLDTKSSVEESDFEQSSTISIAVPGSILEIAQTNELRTILSSQIARAACMFQVDEIVVFDDCGDDPESKTGSIHDIYGLKTARRSCVQLARLLQYAECPPYLRKTFFPTHKDLRHTGLMNPLNPPHHLSKFEQFKYREGVVLPKSCKAGSMVNVGLQKEVHIDKTIAPGMRCTVKLLSEQSKKKLRGVCVPPTTPRNDTGIYWGYQVRQADSLSAVFSQCPYKKGYDFLVGTSDKGTSVDEFSCTPYRHMLIVFGGVQGLERAVESDPLINEDDPSLLFDEYLNTLPDQGSKTIRTEEAILVTLAAIRPKLTPQIQPKAFDQSSIKNIRSNSQAAESINSKAAEVAVADTACNSSNNRNNSANDMSRFD